jgi:acetyl esterase/lipase
MNRLKIVKLISRLRGEPFAVSSIPFADDWNRGDDDWNRGDGERWADRPEGQVPSRERVSTLKRAVVYAERPGRKRRRLRMDIHVPETAGPHPLVLYIPGGGFAVAQFRMGRPQRGYVADAGFVVASMEYRTVGDGATYEDGLADVSAAIAYLRNHEAAYRVDVSRVALWGESSGGYLAALAATRGVAGGCVMGVVDVVGASDLSQVADGFDEATQRMWHEPDSLVSRYVGNPLPREANPLEFVDAATPPFLLFHGDDDRIVSPRQSLILHRSLTAAGVSSRRIVLEGAGHGELALSTSDTKIWTSTAVMDEIVGFLTARTGRAAVP